jgi:hypothetical protein
VETKRFAVFDEQARIFFFVVDVTTGSETGQRIGTGDHAKSLADREEFDSPAKQNGMHKIKCIAQLRKYHGPGKGERKP